MNKITLDANKKIEENVYKFNLEEFTSTIDKDILRKKYKESMRFILILRRNIALENNDIDYYNFINSVIDEMTDEISMLNKANINNTIDEILNNMSLHQKINIIFYTRDEFYDKDFEPFEILEEDTYNKLKESIIKDSEKYLSTYNLTLKKVKFMNPNDLEKIIPDREQRLDILFATELIKTIKVKNNYHECLTNLACSIRKYFDLEYKHNTLKYIDEVFEEYNPKNIVTILCDGMGSNIMDRMLDKDSFLIKNRIKAITTVFPATTVAATTSMMTGLNPVETGMLGWDMYYKDLDKTITVFMNSEKTDKTYTPLPEAVEYNKKHMIRKTIGKEINEQGKYKGYTLFPFGDKCYENLDDMFTRIENLCNEDGKKYIYAYDTDPDSTMHELGCDTKEVKDIIIDLNKRIEELSNKLTDTIIIVVADHGHHNVNNLFIKDYKDIEECLLRNTSLEPRAVNFFIKEEKKDEFINLFNKYFGNDFDIYSMEEIIDSKLFGDGVENEIFRDALGDFLAIGKTDKTLLYEGSDILKSQHAGYTDDEILVPLILVKTKK